ncbi:9124_t:CDS:1, partial [Cetraspora pellucida]
EENVHEAENNEEYSSSYDQNNLAHIQSKLQHWQRCVANILSIACNLPNSLNNSSLNMLRVYNDLSKSIPLAQLLQIKQCGTDLFSKQSIDVIFRIFDKLDRTKINLFSRRSFTFRCLNTIPLETPVRSHLYTKIFSQEPLPFTFYTIYLIFEAENKKQNGLLFFNLISNPKTVEGTKRLQVIENILANQKYSEMSALCCDVIQTHLSTEYQFDKLSSYFLKATDILISNSKKLQKITAIAILK